MNSDRIEPGKFNLIYADPPWRFKNWSMNELAERGEKWARRNGRSPYDVMDLQDICALPVGDLAAKDAFLAMWITDPKINEGLQVMGAWGFEYVTVLFHWVKTDPLGLKINYNTLLESASPILGNGKTSQIVRLDPDDVKGWHFGLGYHSRANPELCLLGKRGKGLRRVDNTIPRLIVAPVGEHSQKPNEARHRIVRLYGDVPRAELFARQRVPGWDIWGNEAPEGSDIQLP